MATTTDDEQVLEEQPVQKIPFLEPGDHLTRQEFLRRCEAMPRLKKAELIEGKVYMPAAVRHSLHGKPHGVLMTWVGTYAMQTRHLEFGDNSPLLLDSDNAPQPDVYLLVEEQAGGQTKLNEDDYLEGAPELVCEVSSSSASYDLHEKLQVYRRNGVQEYLVWKVLEKAVVWYHLENEEYRELRPDEQGGLSSQVFPGLWLDVPALLGNESAKVLATLQRGMLTEDHQWFVQQLREAVAKHHKT